MSSLITQTLQAACFLKPQGEGELLATYGPRKMPLFSKVHAFNVVIFFSLSNTSLDVSGRLEGESIVEEAIRSIPNLWCFEEPPLSLASDFRPTRSAIRNSPSLAAATKITSAEGIPIRDWREPIHRMLKSRDVNIRFTDNPPSSPSSGYSTASS